MAGSDNMKVVLRGASVGENRKANEIMNYVGIDIHKRYSVCVAQDVKVEKGSEYSCSGGMGEHGPRGGVSGAK